MVLALFLWWESRRLERGEGALIDPALLRNIQLRSGVISFLFMFLIQAGIFFVVPLFLSVALGLSAIETGVRLLPLSLTLLAFAVGRPEAAPERHRRGGSSTSASWRCSPGLVLLVALLDVGAGPEIVTWPLLLAGSGLGAMASQLGAVTVSAVPGRAERRGRRAAEHRHPARRLDRHRAGGRRAHLRADRVVLHRHPEQPGRSRQRRLEGTDRARGRRPVPLRRRSEGRAVDEANVPPATADAVVETNAQSRIDGLRAAVSILALLALVALLFTRGIPTVQPGAESSSGSPPT